MLCKIVPTGSIPANNIPVGNFVCGCGIKPGWSFKIKDVIYII